MRSSRPRCHRRLPADLVKAGKLAVAEGRSWTEINVGVVQRLSLPPGDTVEPFGLDLGIVRHVKIL